MYIKAGNRKLKILLHLIKYWFPQILDSAWHKQMVKAKKLEKDKKDGETVVRVKNYGFRL